MRRLEQVTALVVAAGLAIVSYWLFFSWAGGGGYNRPKPGSRSESIQSMLVSESRLSVSMVGQASRQRSMV